jgi:uncharacterized protein with von Willebrand factor type A (vWA) domain
MSGFIDKVAEACKELINSRKSLNKDKVSMIFFNDVARLKYVNKPIGHQFEFEKASGGTNFSEAFKECKGAYQVTSSNFQPIIIFMTDGQAPVIQAV